MLGEPQHIAGPHRFRGPEKPGKLRHGFLNGKHGVKQKCDRCVAACIYLYIVMCIYIYCIYTCMLFICIYLHTIMFNDVILIHAINDLWVPSLF